MKQGTIFKKPSVLAFLLLLVRLVTTKQELHLSLVPSFSDHINIFWIRDIFVDANGWPSPFRISSPIGSDKGPERDSKGEMSQLSGNENQSSVLEN